MRTKRNPGIRITYLVAGLLLILATAALGQGKVIAVGDVHGAYPQLVSILQHTGLVDANHVWTGGRTTLIQTGDILDRGRQVRDCLDLMIELERQARKAGGQVIPLLGNHETINIMGDTRYATADIFRSFSTGKSESLREQAYRDYLKFYSGHRDHSHATFPADDAAAKLKWMDQHPPGFFEYRDALAPNGKYGAWIRTHHAIVRIGDGLFMHGGLSPALQFKSVEDLDSRIGEELAAFDSIWQDLVRKKVIWRYMTFEEALRQAEEELKWMQDEGKNDESETALQIRRLLGIRNSAVSSSEGPLWYRGLAQDPEDKLMGDLKAMLARLNAKYIVSGHTVVSKSGVTARFDNQVFLIDVGMLTEVYGGRAAALEIQNGQITAHYSDGESKVLVAKGDQSR